MQYGMSGMPYQRPRNMGPMKPQMPRPLDYGMPRPFDYGHPLFSGNHSVSGGLPKSPPPYKPRPQAHIPENTPRPQAHIPENGPSLGGGTGPMQQPPGGDPRMLLAQKMAAVEKQKMYGQGGMPRPQKY